MNKGYSVLGDDELEDFLVVIKKRGFDKNNFELTEQPQPVRNSDVQPITGTVTVRCKVTGIERTYIAVHGSTWPTDFSTDLAHGLFGRPR